jgi:hypothetical protein
LKDGNYTVTDQLYHKNSIQVQGFEWEGKAQITIAPLRIIHLSILKKIFVVARKKNADIKLYQHFFMIKVKAIFLQQHHNSLLLFSIDDIKNASI